MCRGETDYRRGGRVLRADFLSLGGNSFRVRGALFTGLPSKKTTKGVLTSLWRANLVAKKKNVTTLCFCVDRRHNYRKGGRRLERNREGKLNKNYGESNVSYQRRQRSGRLGLKGEERFRTPLRIRTGGRRNRRTWGQKGAVDFQ